jgi:hypothetical protein
MPSLSPSLSAIASTEVPLNPQAIDSIIGSISNDPEFEAFFTAFMGKFMLGCNFEITNQQIEEPKPKQPTPSKSRNKITPIKDPTNIETSNNSDTNSTTKKMKRKRESLQKQLDQAAEEGNKKLKMVENSKNNVCLMVRKFMNIY